MIRDETGRKIQDRAAPESAQIRRLPYGWVALALLVLIVALAGGALVLDQRLKMPVGVIPTATHSAVVGPQVIGTSVTGVSGIGQGGQVPSEQVIEEAYLKYWDVYATAMLTLDASKLTDVAAGDRLVQAIAEVNDMKARGSAAKIEVEHHSFVIDATPTTARVYDQYINKSYAVDPQTQRPVGAPGQSQELVDTYTLEWRDGVWKVTAGLRQSP